MAGYKRRRRFRRRRPYGKRRRFGRRYRRKGLRRFIDRVIQSHAEKKYVHWNMQTEFGSVSTAWTELHVTNQARGADCNQFIGKEWRIKSLYFYGYLSLGANYVAGDDATNLFRIFVGLWPFSSGTTPCGTLGIPLNTQIQKSHFPYQLTKRYFDRTYNLEAKVGDYDSAGYVPHRIKVKWRKVWKGRGLRIRLDDAGNIVNRLIISMISDSTTVSHPGFVSGHCKISYYDV